MNEFLVSRLDWRVVMPEKCESDAKSARPVERGRVKALAVLGLGVGVAYAAPIVLRLNRVEAHVTTPTHCAEKEFKPQHCL